MVVVSAKVESELNGMPDEEAAEWLEMLGVEQGEGGGLAALIRATYKTLGLQTYFTTGKPAAGVREKFSKKACDATAVDVHVHASNLFCRVVKIAQAADTKCVSTWGFVNCSIMSCVWFLNVQARRRRGRGQFAQA